MMNFNLTSRVQQQQQSHPPQNLNQLGAGMSSNQSSFPASIPGQQKPPQSGITGMAGDDNKQPIQGVVGANPQALHHPQNNNNNSHGMNLPSPQQLLMQQNRNANVTTHQQINKTMHQQMTTTSQHHQATFHQQQQLMSSITKMGGPNMNIIQQMNQLVYHGPSNPSSHSMQHSIASPNAPQKFQTGQHQLQMRQNYGGSPPHVNTTSVPSSQQHMQYSPSKPIHPQMKTTAKLASPGSQLQKSPPQGTSPIPSISQVPSTQPSNVSSANPQVAQIQAPALVSNVNPISSAPGNVTSSPIQQPAPVVTNTNLQKSPVIPSLLKSVPVAVTTTTVSNVSSNVQVSTPIQSVPQIAANSSSTVPSSVTQTSPSIAPIQSSLSSQASTEPAPKEVPASVAKEQVKQPETKPVANDDAGQKATPVKTNSEEKKPIENPTKPIPAISSAVVEKQPLTTPQKTTQVSAPIVKSSTLRLATVTTPPRKKPPPTITKKVTPQSQQKTALKNATVPAKSEAIAEKPQKPSPEVVKSTPPSTATKQPSNKSENPKAESLAGPSNVTPKTKRIRTKVQPYQSPTPELALVTKLSTQIANGSGNNKNGEDKLTLFYKNEFLAVRNGEGGFYLCQAMHNVYRSSPKIKIRWLNEREEGKLNEAGGRTYNLDFYDLTDLECVLTTVDLEKVEPKTYELPKEEVARIESILKKAIDVEKGVLPRPSVTENNPDGLDLSIYKDESQLDKLSTSRKRGKSKKSEDSDDSEDDEPLSKKKKSAEIPAKKTLTPRTSTRKPIVDGESSESDEENLMEIKKKAKNQVEASKSEKVTAKSAVENTASKEVKTEAQPGGSGRGRKRAADKITEQPSTSEKGSKVLKLEKNVEAKQSSPEKVSPKAAKNLKSAGKTAALPAGKETVKDKKQSAKDKPSDSTTVVKKEIVSKVQTSPVAAVSKPKTPNKEKSTTAPVTPIKKAKEEVSATKTSPRGRNTRSKK